MIFSTNLVTFKWVNTSEAFNIVLDQGFLMVSYYYYHISTTIKKYDTNQSPGHFYFHLFICWLHSVWDLSLLTRDWTSALCIWAWSLNDWTTGEVPSWSLLVPKSLGTGEACFPPLLWQWVPSVRALALPSWYSGLEILESISSSFKNFIFWPHHMTCGILVSWPGIEPTPPALKVQF